MLKWASLLTIASPPWSQQPPTSHRGRWSAVLETSSTGGKRIILANGRSCLPARPASCGRLRTLGSTDHRLRLRRRRRRRFGRERLRFKALARLRRFHHIGVSSSSRPATTSDALASAGGVAAATASSSPLVAVAFRPRCQHRRRLRRHFHPQRPNAHRPRRLPRHLHPGPRPRPQLDLWLSRLGFARSPRGAPARRLDGVSTCSTTSSSSSASRRLRPRRPIGRTQRGVPTLGSTAA